MYVLPVVTLYYPVVELSRIGGTSWLIRTRLYIFNDVDSILDLYKIDWYGIHTAVSLFVMYPP